MQECATRTVLRYAASVRWAAFVLLVGCGFSITSGPSDAPDAPPPDMSEPGTWKVDPASGKAVPANTTEWMELIAARGLGVAPPASLWQMQEATGSLADSIGSVTLNPLNLPTYTNVIPGWTRVGVGTRDTTQNNGFLSKGTGNLNGTSYLLLLYVTAFPPVTGDRAIAAIGENGDYRYVGLTTTNRYQANGIGVTPVTGTADPGTAVHPVLLKINSTMFQHAVYTDQEKIAATWVGPSGAGNNFVVGNGAFGSTSARYLYGALWSGASAEMSDANIKAMLQAMGWTVTGF